MPAGMLKLSLFLLVSKRLLGSSHSISYSSVSLLYKKQYHLYLKESGSRVDPGQSSY